MGAWVVMGPQNYVYKDAENVEYLAWRVECLIEIKKIFESLFCVKESRHSKHFQRLKLRSVNKVIERQIISPFKKDI